MTVLSAQSPPVTFTPKHSFGLGSLSVAAVSPDRKYLATAGESAAYLWDYERGEVLHRLQGHGTVITAVSFSPDGGFALTGARNGSIGIWSTRTGLSERLYSAHKGEVLWLSFRSDGRQFVSTSADNTACVWSLASGELLQRVTVRGSFINAAIFTPDGGGLITADNSPTNTVRLWDLQSGATTRLFGEPAGQTLALTFLANGWLAAAGDDRKVRLWNIETGQLVKALEGSNEGVRHLVAVPNSSILIAGGFGKQVTVWDALTGEVLKTWAGETLNSLTWVPGTEHVLAASPDLLVREIDFRTGVLQRTFSGHTTSVTSSVAFSPDGQYLLSSGVEAAIRIWNRTNGQLTRVFTGHASGSPTAVFSPDGRLALATAGGPRQVAQIWNVETGQLERELHGHTGWLLAATFSPDGRRVATGAQDRTVRLWNSASGQLLRTWSTDQAFAHCVAFSPDGKLLAAGGSTFDPTSRIWDVETGELKGILTAEAGTVTAVAFTPSGNELVVAWEEGLIRVLDLTSGQVSREFVSAGFIHDAALSPDGELLAIAEGWPAFTSRLIEWRSGRVLRILAGHTMPVGAVAFSAKGTQLVTGSDIVRLWDIADLATRFGASPTPDGLALRWRMGTLQQAPTVDGPWFNVPNAASPWVAPLASPGAFFRIALPADD
jgi:WD40 repeat protein